MEFYEWNNKRFIYCDVFACFTDAEFNNIKKHYGKPDLKVASFKNEGTYFFFINTENKQIAPMSQIYYAFGGGYNGYPPYGNEIKNFSFNYKEYELVTDNVFIELSKNMEHG